MAEQRPAEAGSSGAPAFGKEQGMEKKEVEPCMRVLGWEIIRNNKHHSQSCRKMRGLVWETKMNRICKQVHHSNSASATAAHTGQHCLRMILTTRSRLTVRVFCPRSLCCHLGLGARARGEEKMSAHQNKTRRFPEKDFGCCNNPAVKPRSQKMDPNFVFF